MAVNDYFTSDVIPWADCVGFCTYQAAALTGRKKGFQAEAQQIGLRVNLMHCIIGRNVLAPRTKTACKGLLRS